MTLFIVLDHLNRPLAVFDGRQRAEQYQRDHRIIGARIVERPYHPTMKEVA